MPDYSYKKSNPELTIQAILDSTGIQVQNVLDTPEEVVVVSTSVPLSPEDEKQLDGYMTDIGFDKVF